MFVTSTLFKHDVIAERLWEMRLIDVVTDITVKLLQFVYELYWLVMLVYWLFLLILLRLSYAFSRSACLI